MKELLVSKDGMASEVMPGFMAMADLRREMNRCGCRRIPFLWGIDYEMQRSFLIENPLQQTQILWQIAEAGNALSLTPKLKECPEIVGIHPMGESAYERMFGRIREGLMRGDSFLANLTGRTAIDLFPRCSLQEIFLHSKAPYRLCLGDEFVCFSPEPFVEIENGRISTFPMKGTIDASLPDAEATLLNDYKESCEHFTIADLMRNDLNRVACNVVADRYRYVERVATCRKGISGAILQTSSRISGDLPAERACMFGDIILPLLPAGSITGAPKEATVEMIREAEECGRGWYTGVFGYYDGRKMRSAVMIRAIQRDPIDGRLYFHSGGGVTVNSTPGEEYAELIQKIYLG